MSGVDDDPGTDDGGVESSDTTSQPRKMIGRKRKLKRYVIVSEEEGKNLMLYPLAVGLLVLW